MSVIINGSLFCFDKFSAVCLSCVGASTLGLDRKFGNYPFNSRRLEIQAKNYCSGLYDTGGQNGRLLVN